MVLFLATTAWEAQGISDSHRATTLDFRRNVADETLTIIRAFWTKSWEKASLWVQQTVLSERLFPLLSLLKVITESLDVGPHAVTRP